MEEGVVGREGWRRECMLTILNTKQWWQCYCHHRHPSFTCITCLPHCWLWHAPACLLSHSQCWGHGCACHCHLWALVTLSFMGTGHSTAIVGGIHGCWVVNVVYWVLAIICCLLSALHVAVNWAVVVFCVAMFVCGGVVWCGSKRCGGHTCCCWHWWCGCVIVMFGCQVDIMVCGQPGMFIVVGVTCTVALKWNATDKIWDFSTTDVAIWMNQSVGPKYTLGWFLWGGLQGIGCAWFYLEGFICNFELSQ